MTSKHQQQPPESHKQPTLQEFAENIYFTEYPISFAGCRFNARMTVIRMSDGKLLLHSPCDIDDALKREIQELGQVSMIVAPGNYHYLHVLQCKEVFPDAQVYLSLGLDKKQPKLMKLPGAKVLYDKDVLDRDIQHVFLSGNRVINEIVFYHVPSKTLVLTDSIEYIGDDSRADTNWFLRAWWVIMRMWNKPKPAPEYQMGWWCKNKQESRGIMQQILSWDFERVIIAHGQNITNDSKTVVRQAWDFVLE